MSDGVAYRSASPDVLAAWSVYEEHVAEVNARREAFGEKMGYDLMATRSWGGGNRITALADRDATDEELTRLGLRRERGRFHLVPRMSTKAGKVIAAEMGALDRDDLTLPGMPSWTFVGLSVVAPTIFEHEGVLWARWPVDIEVPDDELNQRPPRIDPDIWRRTTLSKFYAAKEAAA